MSFLLMLVIACFQYQVQKERRNSVFEPESEYNYITVYTVCKFGYGMEVALGRDMCCQDRARVRNMCCSGTKYGTVCEISSPE